jgi:hypothetical protein
MPMALVGPCIFLNNFDLTDAPSRISPVGSLMRRILDELPDRTFEQARQLANQQLLKAAAKRNYRVTMPRQDKETAERFRKRVNPTPESGKSGLSKEAA